MTDAQIRYRQLVETKRHNVEQEVNWSGTLSENTRHNRASEELSRYATDVQAQTSRSNAALQAETSRYTAETSAAASRYAADQSASASRYATDRGYAGKIESANISALASNYRTDVESADRQKRLEFDRATQAFKNNLDNKRVMLDAVLAKSKIGVDGAQISKLTTETSAILEKLLQEERRIDLQERSVESTESLNRTQEALNKARTLNTHIKSADSALSVAKELRKIIGELIAMPW